MTTTEWQDFASTLVEYGYAVFRAWLGSRQGGPKMTRRTVRGMDQLPSPFELNQDEVNESRSRADDPSPKGLPGVKGGEATPVRDANGALDTAARTH